MEWDVVSATLDTAFWVITGFRKVESQWREKVYTGALRHYEDGATQSTAIVDHRELKSIRKRSLIENVISTVWVGVGPE